MSPVLDDAQVIAASLAESAAFAEIYDRHARTLLSYLIRRVGVDEGEPLLGEVFRIAFEQRHRFDQQRSTARPWLYGIAANLVMKHHRHVARRTAAYGRSAALVAPPVGFEDRLVERRHAEALTPRLISVIGALPEHDREVLFLYAWQELSYADIAEALAIPVGTVRSRLNRVRRSLRELDDATGEEPGEPPARAEGRTTR